ncbi:MAG: TIGR02452 family protein [Anaerolineae bacterium]
MSHRKTRAQIASETLEILGRGYYHTPDGRTVHIETELNSAISMSVHYKPADFDQVFAQRDRMLAGKAEQAIEFEVTNESTLHAALRLAQSGDHANVLALNFASARNPGGGFLKGSQAQEESLARASGLYPCIVQMKAMYHSNRRFRSCLYTDNMIYSPRVPVFRDDSDRLLEVPYLVSFVTAPAVNAGVVRRRGGTDAGRIGDVMLGRIEKVLSLAVIHHHDALVLGAWGCGVFRNDPSDVARWFGDHLAGNGLFAEVFKKVVFAVLDRTPSRSVIRPFESVFLTANDAS